jgi:hypothetical protein
LIVPLAETLFGAILGALFGMLASAVWLKRKQENIVANRNPDSQAI